MKPARWRRHLNIFPSASRNTDIQEASCPHPYPLPYICHLPTHRSVPPYTGRGAVLLIEPNFDRSALLYHSPFLWPPQTSGKWYVGEISTWRAYSVPSATSPSPCNASLPHRSAPHHPHPWPPTRCDAKIRETIFKKVGKNIDYEIYKEEIDSRSFTRCLLCFFDNSSTINSLLSIRWE